MAQDPRQDLTGKHIAILATDGFEQDELTMPRAVLARHGADVEVVAPKRGDIQGYKHHDRADKVSVDAVLEETDPSQFDALVLPGGVMNPDALRIDQQAVDFVEHFVTEKKPIAAICHGPWTLINAHGIDGRRMTSWPSLEADLRNAGADWVDEEVVLDRQLVTSRNPDDLPAFCRTMIEAFSRDGSGK